MQFFLFGGGGRHGDKAQKSIVCVFYFVDMHFTKWTCNGVICRSLSLQQRKEEEAPFYLSFGEKKRIETHLVFFPHIKSFVLGVCCSFFAIDSHIWSNHARQTPLPPPATTPFFAHLSWWRTWGWRGSWSRCRPGCWARAATPSCSSAAARWGSGSRSLWCRDRTTPRCRPARCPPPPAGSSESWRRRPWPGGGLGNKKTGGLFFFFFYVSIIFGRLAYCSIFFFQQIPKINQGDLCGINDRVQGVFRFSHAKINNWNHECHAFQCKVDYITGLWLFYNKKNAEKEA